MRPGSGGAGADHRVASGDRPALRQDPAQVALRWLIENDTVLPIPGAKNRKQATANAAALTFHLAQDEIEALDTATRGLRLTPGALAQTPSGHTHIGMADVGLFSRADAGGVLTNCRTYPPALRLRRRSSTRWLQPATPSHSPRRGCSNG